MHIRVHADAAELTEAAADLVSDAILEADDLSIGLSGGSTPIAMYRLLRDRDLPWSRVDAWMSDERWVPSDHPECNGHQAATELIDHVEARLHRPRWAPWLSPADSAAHFEAELRHLHPDGRAHLILLGMGADGHTASLFPGTAALKAPPERWFVHNEVPQLDTVRLTTTYSFLRAAHRLVFLVAGAAKADAVRRVLQPTDGEEPLPASGVMGGDAAVTWLIDESAASHLTRP